MRHSTFLLAALPAVMAYEAVVTDVAMVTEVATVYQTVTAGQAAATSAPVQAAAYSPAPQASAPAPAVPQVHNHEHAAAHNHQAAPSYAPAPAPPAPSSSVEAQAPASSQAPAPAPYSAAPKQSSAPASSAGGDKTSGGCPKDTSGAHLSPGYGGNPDKSMVDSINYIRRLYNSAATCLQWSDNLADSATKCANAGQENVSFLQPASNVVSDMGYQDGMYPAGKLASSQFEASMFIMLCQSPGDSELQGTCPFKTGEVGCSAGACTGHHDAIVDKDNTDTHFGAGCNEDTKWLSASFASHA